MCEWHWTYGDGSSSTGPTGEHLFEDPGRFQIRGDSPASKRLMGLLSPSPPAAPPEILSSNLAAHHGTELALTFNEAVETSQMTSRLASGYRYRESHAHRSRWITDLHPTARQKPLQDADTLHLSGIADQAQKAESNTSYPNRGRATLMAILQERPGVSLGNRRRAESPVRSRVLGAETAVTLTPRGTARFDSAFAMRPAGGFFAGVRGPSIAIESPSGSKRTYEISVEAVLTPATALQRRQGVILTSASKSRSNFTLSQQGQGTLLLPAHEESRRLDVFQDLSGGHPTSPAGPCRGHLFAGRDRRPISTAC